MQLKTNRLIINALLVLSTLLFYVHGDSSLAKYVFIFQFALFATFGLLFTRKILYFFSPSFITTAYICINMAIGLYAFENDLIYKQVIVSSYINEDVIVRASMMFFAANIIVFNTFRNRIHDFGSRAQEKMKQFQLSRNQILKFFIVIPILFAVDIVSDRLGTQGGIFTIPVTISILYISYMLSRSRERGRWIFYPVIILVSLFLQFDSKREVVFLIGGIFIIESFSSVQLRQLSSIKVFFTVLVLGVAAFYLIIAMSITRGFGYYGVKNPIEALTYVDDYVSDENNIRLVLNNIEATTVFFHSYNATNMFLNREAPLLYGKTFAKILFFPFPRSVLPIKPNSIIHEYTYRYDPYLREEGRSVAVSLYPEYFWNFDWVGFLILFGVFLLFNEAYFYGINSFFEGNIKIAVMGVFLIAYFVGYLRGSGIDLYLLYLLIAYGTVRLLYYIIGSNKLSIEEDTDT